MYQKKHQLVKASVFSLMISMLTSEIKYIIGDKYSVPLFCKFVPLFYGLTEHCCRGKYFQNTYRLLENNLSVKTTSFLISSFNQSTLQLTLTESTLTIMIIALLMSLVLHDGNISHKLHTRNINLEGYYKLCHYHKTLYCITY